ncbi:MAG: hypothetical protein ACOCNS_00535 [Bacteroidales bacterium]
METTRPAHQRQTYEVFAEIHDYKAPFSAKKVLFAGQKSAILKKLRTFAMFPNTDYQ